MIQSFDNFFYHLINQTLTAEWLDFIMLKFSDKIFWIPFYCVIIWVLFKNYGKQAFLILVFLAVAVLLSDRLSSGVMKPLIKRQRPCFESTLTPRDIGEPCNGTGSMPSSHASNHFAVALFFILLSGIKNKLSTTLWFLWALAIAYSRVYCGVHYPTDVLAGAMLGSAIGMGCYYLYQLINKRIKWQ